RPLQRWRDSTERRVAMGMRTRLVLVHGSSGAIMNPRIDDAHGDFTVANLFAGLIRISAASRIDEEVGLPTASLSTTLPSAAQ
ncbi:MAG TPA: hypothetical protein VEZ11_17140, partial [Thermoanaerobaculia bacterium]|nr:hypothetical protein [Thermoanaerobaculia bacterium]